MSSKELMTIIIGILGALHIPKLYEFIYNIFSSTQKAKIKNKDEMIERIRRYKAIMRTQEKEIRKLKTQISSINTHLAIIIPILKNKFADDKETVNLLDNLMKSSKENTTGHFL